MLDITEVVRRSGVPASTLRYYEEKGLILSTGRRGLKRIFAPGILDQLALIALGRAAGFSLDEIGEMFDAGGEPSIDRDALSAKADELDDTAGSSSPPWGRPCWWVLAPLPRRFC